MTTKEIMPGDRVLVYDSLAFVDDITTPVFKLMRPATIICRYGYRQGVRGRGSRIFSDIVDVVFDHRSEFVSHGHFTNYIKPM